MKKLLIVLFILFLPITSFSDDFSFEKDKMVHLFYGAVIGKEINNKYKNKPFLERILLIESGVFFVAFGKGMVDNDLSLTDITYTMIGGMLFITIEDIQIYLVPYNHGEGGLLKVEWKF